MIAAAEFVALLVLLGVVVLVALDWLDHIDRERAAGRRDEWLLLEDDDHVAGWSVDE